MKRPVNSIWGRSSPCNLFPPSEGEKERRKSRRRNQDSVSGFFTGGQEQRNRETGERNSSLSPRKSKHSPLPFFFHGRRENVFSVHDTGSGRASGSANRHSEYRGEKNSSPPSGNVFSSGRDRDLLFSPLCFSRSSPQAEPGAGAAHVHVKRRRKTQQEWTSFR